MLHYARHEGEAIGEARGRMEGLALGRLEGETIGEARGRMQLAALLKSGKTLDEALAILQAETQDGSTASY
jgi:type II secretory pathway component PulF